MRHAGLLIIGGGPAGYVAALRAAQLGAKPLLVEGGQLGGTCLNRGCIPTKSLIESAGLLHRLGRAAEHGIKLGKVSLDLKTMVGRKDNVAAALRQSLEVLLPDRGVEVMPGVAAFTGPREAAVTAGESTEAVTFEQAIVCSGSLPWVPPVPGLGLPGVIGSDEALSPREVPETLAVIGGGAVGCEFAGIYANLGSKVTVIELLPSLLPTEDAELGEALRFYLESRGVRVLTGARVECVEADREGQLSVRVAGGDAGAASTVSAARVLAAIGRRPNSSGLSLPAAGVVPGQRGEIPVDETMRTSAPGIFAAGDVTGGILLAHVAFEQGVVAAENALGRQAHFSPSVVPRCTFTEPEVAAVGLSEGAAVKEGYEVAVGRFPFANSGRAMAMSSPDGFVKVVAEAGSGQLLGIHIIGPQATELIAEAAMALAADVTVGGIAHLIHAHPTLAEAFREAALDTRGEALHK